MKILMLGGTSFLGRHLVEASLASGHQVTLFNRGQTNPTLFPQVEKLQGNRDGDLGALAGRQWDAVIDTSGYVPRIVRQSVERLKHQVKQYVFVSSVSVYEDFSQLGLTETDSVLRLPDVASEDVQTYYGALKALCEQEVQAGFGESSLIIRPGLIVGPHDPTDRFTYWVRRFSQGGEVLVPQNRSGKQHLQFIDARDLAAWMVELVEGRVNGVYNATGPLYELTMAQFIATLTSTIQGAGSAVWVTEEFLLSKEVEEYQELPLWVADATQWPGFERVSIKQALAVGLNFRSLDQTIRDTLLWDQCREQKPMRAGLSNSRERNLLREWREV